MSNQIYAIEVYTRTEDEEKGLVLYQLPKNIFDPNRPEFIVRIWGLPLKVAADDIMDEIKSSDYEVREIDETRKCFLLTEDLGIQLILLFWAIKPLRNEKRIEDIVEGIATMSKEEVYYWFNLCQQKEIQKRARRALRILLSGD